MALGRAVLGLLSLLLLLPAAVLGEDCQAYIDYSGKEQPAQSCPDFCCGSCARRFCCSNVMLRFARQPLQCVLPDGRMYVPGDLLNNIQEDDLTEHLDESSEKIKDAIRKMRESISNIRISDSGLGIFEDPDDFMTSGLSFGTLIAIGVTVCAVIIITIVLCFTCSCCCLYKACRRPRPVVTTTATTTVVHAPYPQQAAVPPSYPAAPYQGYQPMAIQPQPGMPAAPYPTQYPPPYPMQPSGPPAYHETVAAGAGAPYPSQPPYNPAYMDPQKPTY
ncbi:protein shisa-5 isoform X1 [Myiozetetes cayanensis]|uniref:protein shisa-5 isoform X1 n=2 Tax=Myiozetetes cayanensis TaxID=478635 RepID=UPI00215FE2EF|nr:protein shisa-5 isoform X1 [Myiozetetes cayanensis]